MATGLMNTRLYSIQGPTPVGSEWDPQVHGPHFVVIGAQKAGSSFIQDALRAHPEIYMPRGESSLFHGADVTTTRAELEQIARKGRAMRIVGIKEARLPSRSQRRGANPRSLTVRKAYRGHPQSRGPRAIRVLSLHASWISSYT